MSDGAQLLSTIAGFLAAAGAFARLSTHTRVHALGIPALSAGWVVVVAAVAPRGLQEHAALALVALAIAVGIGWFMARLLTGREAWLLAAAAAMLTLRVPVPLGSGQDAMLLGPLYAMIAIGALMLARVELRTAFGGSGGARRTLDRDGATRMLDVGTYGFPIVAALSLLWTFDPRGSAQALAFFLIPFPLAYALVRAWVSRGVALRPAALTLIGVGTVAAAVGLVQAAARVVWWNPKVIDANRFRPDFRTNSLFWDPNIYGRALVVALLALVAWALLVHSISRARMVLAALVAVTLVTALWNTYSQSSWFALAAALAVMAVLTLPPRLRSLVGGVLLVATVVVVPFAARDLHGADAIGRESVVRTGLALAGERPVRGWGVGSFEDAAAVRAAKRGEADPGLLASHTTPVTVLAELGIIGMAAYLALLAAAAVAILARWRQAQTPAVAAHSSESEHPNPRWPDAPIVWAAAAVVALFAHSLLYAGFFEDATLWVALALLASLPAVRPRQSPPASADPSAAEPMP